MDAPGGARHVAMGALTLVPGRTAGAASHVRGLLKACANGHGPERVTVLATPSSARALVDLGRGPVHFRVIRTVPSGSGAVARATTVVSARALRLSRDRKLLASVDVVHYPVTVPVPKIRAPSVVTLHDVLHHVMPQAYPRSVLRYRRLAYDGAARAATIVITVSEFSRSSAVEALGLDPERVKVVYPGPVDPDRFSAEPQYGDDEVLSGLGLPPRYVIYPAILDPHKNHGLLVRALAQTRNRDVVLVLTGPPAGLERLMEEARRASVMQRVVHLGYVTDPVMNVLYRNATAMIFPSLYEGFGAPPLEAMACGCPVSSSTRGSLAEVCGEAVLPLEPESVESVAEAIDRMVEDGDLRARLRTAGLSRAARFTWEAAAQRHREVYRAAMQFGA